MISRFRSPLPAPRTAAFDYHARPGAFERLTPPWEDVEVVERDSGIRDGARVTLRVKKGPVPLTWTLEHRDHVQNEQFADVQVEGPFAEWRHLHRFEDAPDGGTIMDDEVTWEPPLGPAGDFLAAPIIRKDLERLFRFRHRRLADDLALHERWRSRERLTVAISGASGLIGSHLTHLLTTAGHAVVPLVRNPADAGDGNDGPRGIWFSPSEGELDAEGLRGVDVVVHLAGEPIQALRWTDEKKRAIRDSRVKGTELLSRTVAGLRDGPRALICASAVGYYGGRGDDILDESAGPGRGFLADTVVRWEEATRRAEGAGIRVVKLRTGLVLSAAGGALPKMLWAFRSGLGGRLGSGNQYMSWIDLDDVTGLYFHAAMDPDVRGVLNATAPNPVTNAAFTDVLGRVLNRPTVIPVPSLAVKAALGEMGKELLLKGQRIRPKRTLEAGYRYRFDSIEASLRHQLGRSHASEASG